MATVITLKADSELLPLFDDQQCPALHKLIALARLQDDPIGMRAYAVQMKWTPWYKSQIKPHTVKNGKLIKADDDFQEVSWEDYAVQFLSFEWQRDLIEAFKVGDLKIIDSATRRDAISEWNKPLHRRPDLNSYTPKNRCVVTLGNLNAWGNQKGYRFVTSASLPDVKQGQATRDAAIRDKHKELKNAGVRPYVKEIQNSVFGASNLGASRIRAIVKGN